MINKVYWLADVDRDKKPTSKAIPFQPRLVANYEKAKEMLDELNSTWGQGWEIVPLPVA